MITLDRPTLTACALEDLTASALVVGVGTGPDGPVLLTDALPAEAATALEASFELLGVRGAEDEIHRLPGLGGVPVPLLVLAGVGGLDDDGEAADESLRRAAGAADYDAVVDGSVSRLRPVVLAAGTSIFGMLPLLPDAFFASMAVTIMGGLAFASVLTLLAVPVLYAILFRIRRPNAASAREIPSGATT